MPRRRCYTHTAFVRLTADELSRLKARAQANGCSLSRYLVEAGLGAPEELPDPALRAERERALFHLRKVGVNLNQVARRLNSGGSVTSEQVEDALAAVRAATERLDQSHARQEGA